MNIGKLDRWITIQVGTDTKAVDGSPAGRTWTTFKQVMAGKWDKSGSEGMEHDRDTSTMKTHFKIRFISTLTTNHRILLDNTHYDIEVIKELGTRVGQELTCISKYGEN